VRSRASRASHLRAGTGRPLLGPERDARQRARALTLSADDHDWYRAGEPETRPLRDFAAVIMRKDPPFDMEYVYSTYLLERRARRRARLQPPARHPRQQREDGDHQVRRLHRARRSSPATRRDRAFIDEHEDVIIKPLDGMGGVVDLPHPRRPTPTAT
jgi:glutathione synthase